MLKKKSWNWTELNWGSYNVFIGKTTSRNWSLHLFYEIFFLLKLLFISIYLLHNLVWYSVVMPWPVPLDSTAIRWTSCIDGSHLLPLVSLWILVEMYLPSPNKAGLFEGSLFWGRGSIWTSILPFRFQKELI